jgi:hypothetical protein
VNVLRQRLQQLAADKAGAEEAANSAREELQAELRQAKVADQRPAMLPSF